MNKRIRELGKKAADHPDMFGLYHFGMEELERFAELIVRECIRKIDDMVDDGWYADTDKLNQHFGVGE